MRYQDEKTKAYRILDLTSLTVAEFEQLCGCDARGIAVGAHQHHLAIRVGQACVAIRVRRVESPQQDAEGDRRGSRDRAGGAASVSAARVDEERPARLGGQGLLRLETADPGAR